MLTDPVVMKEHFSGQRHLRVDLGCGTAKHEGCIGVDAQPLPGVDCVLDFQRDRLPFADRSVSFLHSSHALEHLTELAPVLADISRVCEDGAQLELWTPYTWHSTGLLQGHTQYFHEVYYYYACVHHRELWKRITGTEATWVLHGIHYCIERDVLMELWRKRIDLKFALAHMINIAHEMCASISVWHREPPVPYPPFQITYGPTRHDMRYTLAEVEVLPTVPPELRKTHRIGVAWPYPASSRPRDRFLSFLSCVVPASVKRMLRTVVPSP